MDISDMTQHDVPQTLLAATASLLSPLIKMLIRHGISYAAFSELAKTLYFDVAKTEFALPGKKQTSSRISTLTGLSRKEVARLEALPPKEECLDTSSINRAARVISGWVRDEAFQTADHEPADLPFEGGQKSFSALVKRYSGDITARTIADELTRVGSISMTADGLIHLNSRAYVANANDIDKLTILGTDVRDLIKTIDHNITAPDRPHLQRKVAYSRVPADKVPEINQQLTKIAQRNLESMDKVLARYAVTKKTKSKQTDYKRLGCGMYFFEGEQS